MALESIGNAAAAIAPVAEITKPVIPAPSVAAPLVKTEAPAAAPASRETAKAAPATMAMTPIAGRGIRNSAQKPLKGQTTGDPKIDSLIISAAVNHEVEPLLLYSVMCQESAFNGRATSNKGARGLMQLMPATAARFGVKNIFDPEQNIQAGARYLRFLLDLFDGDVSLALAGYNAGEGAVKKYGYTVPPYPETMNYVRKIKRRYITLSAMPDLAGD
jgi:soluble lytic murein transglycosylase-like protein